MNDLDRQLIDAARGVCGEFALGVGWGTKWSAGGVGAALRTAKGDVFTGVCIDLGSGLGFCAEVSAIAEMLKARQTRIEAIVAVAGGRVIPPCGRCRETMAQIDAGNLDCTVLVDPDRAVPLRQLLPDHWLVRRAGSDGAGPGALGGTEKA